MSHSHRSASCGEFSLVVNHPPASKAEFDGRGQMKAGSLAPPREINLYRVEDYAACPEDWDKGDPRENYATYFFGYEERHMVWFDLRNSARLAHDVAVVISAQGRNAISGRTVTFPLTLEQYKNNCPEHGTPFGDNLYCAQCGCSWPAQNYLATTATSPDRFWRDGVRDENGQTAEFVFTKEEAGGVATGTVGKDRNFAFSFAFYKSVAERPLPPAPRRSGFAASSYGGGFLGGGDGILESAGGNYESFGGASKGIQPQSLTRGGAGGRLTRGAAPAAPVSVEKVEVGMGAQVNQGVEADPKDISYWNGTPAARIRIYYCSQAELRRILDGGPRNSSPDGTGSGGSAFRGVKRTIF